MLNRNVNWLGLLKLNFSVNEGRSVLTRYKHTGPFLVQRSFYPEKDRMIPHVYLLHPPGGLVGGDKLVLDVILESGSRALLTTPGSSKFYRTNGTYALQEYTFKLGENAILEWIPQSSIFFSRSKVKINTTFMLETGARIIFFDMLCFGNLSLASSFCPEEVDNMLRIYFPNSVGLRDRLRIHSRECIEKKLGGYQVSAAFFASPADENVLHKVRKLMKSMETINQIEGATLLDNLLIVRVLGCNNQSVEKLIRNIWSVVRPIIVGKKASAPRIWLT